MSKRQDDDPLFLDIDYLVVFHLRLKRCRQSILSTLSGLREDPSRYCMEVLV